MNRSPDPFHPLLFIACLQVRALQGELSGAVLACTVLCTAWSPACTYGVQSSALSAASRSQLTPPNPLPDLQMIAPELEKMAEEFGDKVRRCRGKSFATHVCYWLQHTGWPHVPLCTNTGSLWRSRPAVIL